MRKLLIKLIQTLDGTPAVYGERQSGQSVVELALITPILIILLAGLVEIGWFANNYLTLLDVTRSGARRATVLQDQLSPIFWENVNSYVPNILLPAAYQMPNSATNGTDSERFFYRWYPDRTVPGSWGDSCLGYDPVTNTTFERKFYNEVICTMITSMEPLVLDPENGIDDIIITGYSLQMMPNSTDVYNAPFGAAPQIAVVGRYPTNANECLVLNGGGVPVLSVSGRAGDRQRDPFDVNNNGRRDMMPPSGTDSFTELEGYDAPAGDVANAEKQIGFSLFGNHKIDGTFCVGSDWTIQRVEELVNLPNYDLITADEKSVMPSQGLVLAEMYWEHEMLLKIPILSPVFTAVGNSEGKMVINVWAAFPLPSVQPYFIFGP